MTEIKSIANLSRQSWLCPRNSILARTPNNHLRTVPLSQPDPQSGRLFIVGCSRSGTTLLLSRLAGHPTVYGFPETGLLLRLFGMRGRAALLARLGLSLGREQKSLRKALASVGEDTEAGGSKTNLVTPAPQIRLRAALCEGIGFLDQIASSQGCSWWVEKTPRHYLYAQLITQQIPNARVIHIIRGGADVVASIVDRARRHPERFPRQADPRYAIAQWNRAMRAHSDCWGKTGHVFVVYEDLIAEPERELSRLARQCGLPWHPGLLQGASSGAAFVRPNEVWKRHAVGPIRSRPKSRASIVDAATATAMTKALDLKGHQSLVDRIRALSSAAVVSSTACELTPFSLVLS